jgi:predicted metal-dependent HD superfamily phosphohydrolase
MDIDMAIFGKDDRKYLQYAKDVRKEYYMYNDDQYTAGRVKFLHSLLPKAEKNTLYHTDHFKNTHDPKQARWNILTEIREITGEIPPC